MLGIPANFRKTARWWVVGASYRPALAWLPGSYCRVGTRLLGWRMAACPGVETVFLRHSRPESPSFIPGLSDVDLTVVLEHHVADDPDWMRFVERPLSRLARRFFFLNPDDVRYTTRAELERLGARYEAPVEILYEPSDWTRLAGEPFDPSVRAPLEGATVARLPEFNKWWRRMLPSRLFEPTQDAGGRYVRTWFRGALKNQRHLLAAEGRPVVKEHGYVDDHLPEESEFSDGSGLYACLEEIRNADFQCAEPSSLRCRVLLGVLRETSAFYARTAERAGEPDRGKLSCEGLPHVTEARHTTEIVGRIKRNPDLAGCITRVLVYPVPLRIRETQVDLVLRDDLTEDRFERFAYALAESFGSAHPIVGGRPCRLALYFDRMLETSLPYLGSTTPFLRDHVARCAQVLIGDAPSWLGTGLCPETVRALCRHAHPFQAFNFRRRPMAAYRTCGAPHISAVRHYLETGDMVTDEGTLRERLREGGVDAWWVAGRGQAEQDAGAGLTDARTRELFLRLDRDLDWLDSRLGPNPTS